MTPDSSVISEVLAGNTDAYRILVDRYGNALYGTLIKVARDPDLAEEVTQEAFIKAFERLKVFRRESSFGTWLIRIGIHRLKDHLRSIRRQRVAGVVSLEHYRETRKAEWEPETSATDDHPEYNLEAAELGAALAAEIAKLPPRLGEAFILRHKAGLGYAEISGITGDSEGSLRIRVHRARSILSEGLLEQGYGPGESTRPDRQKAKNRQERS